MGLWRCKAGHTESAVKHPQGAPGRKVLEGQEGRRESGSKGFPQPGRARKTMFLSNERKLAQV